MEFLFFGYTSDLWPTNRAPAWKGLKDLAMMSKSWLVPVQLLAQQFQRETFKIQLKAGTKDEFDNIYSEISLRGEDVWDLWVEIGEGEKYSYGKLNVLLPTKATEEMEVDWGVLLEKFGNCERLDLELVPLESKHLPMILRAARQRCLHLESLVLLIPRNANLMKVMQGEHVDSMMTELYGTLEKLYVKGGRGGLRQLTVHTRNVGERHRSSTEFLENVARFCRNVEYLDGAGKAIELHDYVKCADQWMVSLETWELFSKTCTKLREFHGLSPPSQTHFSKCLGPIQSQT